MWAKIIREDKENEEEKMNLNIRINEDKNIKILRLDSRKK